MTQNTRWVIGSIYLDMMQEKCSEHFAYIFVITKVAFALLWDQQPQGVIMCVHEDAKGEEA